MAKRVETIHERKSKKSESPNLNRATYQTLEIQALKEGKVSWKRTENRVIWEHETLRKLSKQLTNRKLSLILKLIHFLTNQELLVYRMISNQKTLKMIVSMKDE